MIEDVATGSAHSDGRYKKGMAGPHDERGYASIVHNASSLVREIYSHNEVFFADSLVGSTSTQFLSRMRVKGWMRDTVDHNSHVIVIRKRASPRDLASVTTHFGRGLQGSH